MSGPATVIFGADPFIVLLSAAAIEAAKSVVQARHEAAHLRDSLQQQRDDQQALQDTATGVGNDALHARLQVAERDFAHLNKLAESIGYAPQVSATRPSLPESANAYELAQYVDTLQALADQLRPVLLDESARRADALEKPQDADLQHASAAAIPQALAARLLQRIAHLSEIPEQIASLARELEACLPGARASALATELRVQIQALLAARLAAQVQAANAVILEQSLKDLGYQVQEIGHTLFVEGGVVHFRRPGWDNYMVRMRVDPKTKSANFNVIRAVAEGENERSVLDHLAEDRWCSEFPALLKALEARGLQMQVTRRLEAGELPVQLVAAQLLPSFQDEQTMQQVQQRPKQIEIAKK